jgi:hypothetical protein
MPIKPQPSPMAIASAIKDWLRANSGLALHASNSSDDLDLVDIDGQIRVSELATAIYEKLDEDGFQFGEEKQNAN